MNTDTMGACPMGVECISNKTHGGLAGGVERHRVGTGAHMSTAMHRTNGGVQAPMSHGNDHWLPLASSEVPVGVRTMFGSGVGWRTHHAEHKWWGYDGMQYYAWLEGGPPSLSGAPGLGQNPLATSNCCQTNSGLYWIAGAIFALATVVGVKGMKKKGKRP